MARYNTRGSNGRFARSGGSLVPYQRQIPMVQGRTVATTSNVPRPPRAGTALTKTSNVNWTYGSGIGGGSSRGSMGNWMSKMRSGVGKMSRFQKGAAIGGAAVLAGAMFNRNSNNNLPKGGGPYYQY